MSYSFSIISTLFARIQLATALGGPPSGHLSHTNVLVALHCRYWGQHAPDGVFLCQISIALFMAFFKISMHNDILFMALLIYYVHGLLQDVSPSWLSKSIIFMASCMMYSWLCKSIMWLLVWWTKDILLDIRMLLT